MNTVTANLVSICLLKPSQQHASTSQSGDTCNGKAFLWGGDGTHPWFFRGRDKGHCANTGNLGAEFLVNVNTETHIRREQEVFSKLGELQWCSTAKVRKDYSANCRSRQRNIFELLEEQRPCQNHLPFSLISSAAEARPRSAEGTRFVMYGPHELGGRRR